MPIALDPKQTFPIWLESDADKAPRPEFHFHALTISDRQRVHRLPESIKTDESLTADEIVEQSIGLFTDLCTGWSNMIDRKGKPIPYTPENIASVLLHEELWELLFSAAANSHLNHDEKKSSES